MFARTWANPRWSARKFWLLFFLFTFVYFDREMFPGVLNLIEKCFQVSWIWTLRLQQFWLPYRFFCFVFLIKLYVTRGKDIRIRTADKACWFFQIHTSPWSGQHYKLHLQKKHEQESLTSVLLTLYVAETSTGLPANDINLSPCFGARARPGVKGKLHRKIVSHSGARRKSKERDCKSKHRRTAFPGTTTSRESEGYIEQDQYHHLSAGHNFNLCFHTLFAIKSCNTGCHGTGWRNTKQVKPWAMQNGLTANQITLWFAQTCTECILLFS